MTSPERYWTAEDVRALPEDGNRYECIDGVLLVTPFPSAPHQRAFRWLFGPLCGYVEAQRCGELMSAPADVGIVPGTVVQPDIFVFRTKSGAELQRWSDISELILALEILSPGTAKVDRGIKRRFYQRAAVHEYWIIDLDARIVERWTPSSEGPEILRDTLRWAPAGAPEPLEIDLPGFFAKVLGD